MRFSTHLQAVCWADSLLVFCFLFSLTVKWSGDEECLCKRARSPNEERCVRARQKCCYILVLNLVLTPTVTVLGSLKWTHFSFPGNNVKVPLDSPGTWKESLMDVKLCVFEKISINEMYLSDRRLGFLRAFFHEHFT